MLIPAFTFAAVPSSVLHADCVPVLCECGDDYRINIEDFEKKLPDVDAVIISHMRGHNSDMDAIMATQRKNMEAMTAAGQSAYEGMTALARRQAEVAKEAAESATKAMTDMAAASPEERVAKQADLTKTAYTSMFDNGREMMDMASKTADEAVSLVNARFTASIDETKTVLSAK